MPNVTSVRVRGLRGPGGTPDADLRALEANVVAKAAEVDDAAVSINGLLSHVRRMPDGIRSISFTGLDDGGVTREHGYIGVDSRLDIDQTEVRLEGYTVATRPRMEVTNKIAVTDPAGGLVGWLDPEANLDATNALLTAAAGTRDTVDTRISQALDAYGNPKRCFNAHALRNYRMNRRKRTRATPEVSRNGIILIGDSFTHFASRYSGGLAESMIAEQGDGGGGWTGCGFVDAGAGPPYVLAGTQPSNPNGNIRPSSYGMALVGSWTSTYATVPSPDICCANSSTAGDYIRFTAPSSPALSGVDLFWIGTADGVMEYSWDNASWTTINVQGAVGDCSFAALAGVPGSGAVTLYLRVVSGTCRPAGINWKSAASGTVVHKLGATGSRAEQWATQAATASWRAAITALGGGTAQVFHGTNDQGASRTPAAFATDMGTIATNLLTATPGIDIAFVLPWENQRTTNTYAMPLYAAAAAAVAGANDYAFLDTQLDAGPASTPSVYASTGARPRNNVDGIHPEPATGGRVLEASLLTFYNYAN